MSSVSTDSKHSSAENDDQFQVPAARAQIMSAIRVTLHTAVLVAIILALLNVERVTGIVIGLIVGLAFATRSRRIGIRFTQKGAVVTNYFRTYVVESLEGATLHIYLRNRTELEVPEQRQFNMQAVSLLSNDDHEEFLQAIEARGATVVAASIARR